MGKRLKECKSISEIFSVLGEEGCAKIAYYFLLIWFIIPIFMGGVSIKYHSEYPGLWEVTLPIIFSVYGMIITFVGVIGLAFFLCYVGAKKKNLNITVKNYFIDKWKNEPWILFLLAMLAWSFVATLLSGDIFLSFFGTDLRHDGFLMYCIYAGVFGCAYIVLKSELKCKVIKTLAITADVLAVIFILGEKEVPYLGLATLERDTSVFGNSNHYAYFMSIAIMCMTGLLYIYVEEKKKTYMWFTIISIALQMYSLVKNNTLGAYLAVVITMVLGIVIWKKRTGKISFPHLIPLFVLILFTALNAVGVIRPIYRDTVWNSLKELIADLFNIYNGSPNAKKAGTNRIGLWIESLKIIAKHPIFGIGPEMIQEPYYYIGGFDRPHNEYIQHALFCGIPALVFYLTALITLCINRIKNLKKMPLTDIVAAMGVIAYSISAFFGNTMFYTTPYFFMVLGLVAGFCENDSEKKQTPEIKDETEKSPQKRKRDANKSLRKDASFVSSIILSCWGVLPSVVAVGFIPIYINHAYEGILILTYEQIMYNFILACVIGIVGFVAFGIILSNRRDSSGLTTKEIVLTKAKNEIWIVLLLVLLGWSLISALLSEDIVTSFVGTALKRDGFFAYCMYASVMGLAYFVKEKSDKQRAFVTFIAVSDFMALVMMFYEWQIPYLYMMSHSYSTATFMNQNHYGYYICMTIMCLVGLFYSDLMRDKGGNEKMLTGHGWFYLVSLIWQVYALMINNTLGAYVAIVLGMIFILPLWWINKGRLHPLAFLPLVITVVITYLSYQNVITNLWGETIGNCLHQFWQDLFTVVEHSEGFEQAGTNRMALWLATLKAIPEHPIFGFGPEGLTGMFREVNVYDRPHNEYLQMAVFCGIPALVFYLAALISLCVNRCRNLKKLSAFTLTAAGVVIGYLISAFFGFTLYYTTPYFYMFLGFVAGSIRESKQEACVEDDGERQKVDKKEKKYEEG